VYVIKLPAKLIINKKILYRLIWPIHMTDFLNNIRVIITIYLESKYSRSKQMMTKHQLESFTLNCLFSPPPPQSVTSIIVVDGFYRHYILPWRDVYCRLGLHLASKSPLRIHFIRFHGFQVGMTHHSTSTYFKYKSRLSANRRKNCFKLF